MTAQSGLRLPPGNLSRIGRVGLIAAGATALILAASCTPSAKPKDVASPGVEASGDLEFWHFFTDREAASIDQVIADFKVKHPKAFVRGVTLTGVKG